MMIRSMSIMALDYSAKRILEMMVVTINTYLI